MAHRHIAEAYRRGSFAFFEYDSPNPSSTLSPGEVQAWWNGFLDQAESFS